jgi:TMEM175 potassium channel family protein
VSEGDTVYNRIAGQSLDRLAALSDGIFAVSMTLLVLDLAVPASAGIRSESALWSALGTLAPRLIPYLMSFLTLGIFWVGQQTQLSHFARSDRNLAWLHLGFLLLVTLMPFSTGLLAEFTAFRVALVAYWLNIFLLGAMLFAAWHYAVRAGLAKEDVTAEMRRAVDRRILIAQALYAFGALLCVFSTYVSIAFIVLVQLNYAIAPRIKPLYRL